MTPHSPVAIVGGLNDVCMHPGCQSDAAWRVRNLRTGGIVVAACAKHKDAMRTRITERQMSIALAMTRGERARAAR